MKTSFKNTLLAVLLTTVAFITQKLNAQGISPFVEFGIDPKMAKEGPYKGKVNDTHGGTFNFEAKAGIEFSENSNWIFNNARIGFGYESHNAIKYEKWSFFNEKIYGLTNDKRLVIHIGYELSAITRRDEFTSDHRDVTTTYSYGGNIGIYYEIYYKDNPTGFWIGINGNGFRGETEYKMYKSGWWDENRGDMMVTIIRKF